MRPFTRADGTSALPCRLLTAAVLATAGFAAGAHAQSLTVLPVSIQMEPGQLAGSLTIVNDGTAETSIQVRAFKWSQTADGTEQLTASEDVVASPPIGTIAAGATQVVRLVLRQAVGDKEQTYRILVDQIPPAAQSGTVRIALRLSIPVFAEPTARANAHVVYHIARSAAGSSLVAVNDGGKHETIRDVVLTTAAGGAVKLAPGATPYLLAGTTHSWKITDPAITAATGATMHLVAKGDAGAIDQSVAVTAAP